MFLVYSSDSSWDGEREKLCGIFQSRAKAVAFKNKLPSDSWTYNYIVERNTDD